MPSSQPRRGGRDGPERVFQRRRQRHLAQGHHRHATLIDAKRRADSALHGIRGAAHPTLSRLLQPGRALQQPNDYLLRRRGRRATDDGASARRGDTCGAGDVDGDPGRVPPLVHLRDRGHGQVFWGGRRLGEGLP